MITESITTIGIVTCILTDVNTGIQEIKEYKNIMVTTGKVAILRRLAGTDLKTNEGKILYGAIGTDDTAPAATDTTLGTEIVRKAIASTSYNATLKTCTIRTFYTTSEANGALKEFGLFGEDATGSADSGTMFNHANIDITKTAVKTLTIEVVISYS